MTGTLHLDKRFGTVIRRALETAQIKAALAGKPADVAAMEEAMDALKSAQVRALPSEFVRGRVVERVKCELSVEELTDIHTALKSYIATHTDRSPSAALIRDRMAALLVRTTTTITMNTPRNS